MANGLRILMIDDDEVDALIFKREIDEGGQDITVIHEPNASRFLDKFQQEPDAFGAIDLILLDLSLPGMDGFTFLQVRKNVPALAALPVIMTTSSSSIDDINRTFELGAVDYFMKSMRVGQYDLLIQKIEQQLRINIPSIAQASPA